MDIKHLNEKDLSIVVTALYSYALATRLEAEDQLTRERSVELHSMADDAIGLAAQLEEVQQGREPATCGLTSSIDFDKVVRLLRVGETCAYVVQTGGGVATIAAGDTYVDAAGDVRIPVFCGPGWFEGPGWTSPRGATGDLSVEVNDDGVTDPVVIPADADEAAVALAITTALERWMKWASPPCAEHRHA